MWRKKKDETVVGAIIRFYRGEGSIPTLDVTCVCCWLSPCLPGCFSKSPTCFPSFHPSFIIQIPIKPKHSRQRTTQWMRCYPLPSSVCQLLSMVADSAHFIAVRFLLTLMPLATWMYFFINAIDTYFSLKDNQEQNSYHLKVSQS